MARASLPKSDPESSILFSPPRALARAPVSALMSSTASSKTSATRVALPLIPATPVSRSASPFKLRPRCPAPLRRNSMPDECTHLDQIKRVKPKTKGCEECLKMGDSWVHLRLCLSCGHVGCCDSSKNKHATKHFH